MDTDHNTFTVVFEKLYGADDFAVSVPLHQSEAPLEEMEEIAQLRRIVLDITDPEPMSFTTA